MEIIHAINMNCLKTLKLSLPERQLSPDVPAEATAADWIAFNFDSIMT